MGPARVPICPNCFQICTFSHSGKLDPSLSDCESGKKKKKKPLADCLLSCKVSVQPTPLGPDLCLSACLPVRLLKSKQTKKKIRL